MVGPLRASFDSSLKVQVPIRSWPGGDWIPDCRYIVEMTVFVTSATVVDSRSIERPY